MALLPSGDPAVASSLTHSSTTAAAQKLNFTALRTFISDLLGVDSANKALAADTLGAFRRGTILGVVSQAAGVPTGAVIERGSNANGDFVRFADGTQICTGTLPNFAIAANAAAAVGAKLYPAAFTGVAPAVACNGVPNVSADFYGFVFEQAQSLTAVEPVFRNGTVAQTIVAMRYVAIGRWF